MLLKRILPLFLLLLTAVAVTAATVEKETRLFAVNEGVELKMDLYRSDSASILPQPCLIFVFGGGFKEGERDGDLYPPSYNYFAEKGFTIAAID